MHIGMIGGIGPAATDLYYRNLISRCRAKGVAVDATIAHADSVELLANFEADDQAAQAEVYRRLTDRLKSAGAECVAITSVGGHFCIDPFAQVSSLPVVSLIDAVPKRLEALGWTSVGLLGTNTVMKTGMYGALDAFATYEPQGDMIEEVHNAYTSMATRGAVTPEEQALFLAQGHEMIERGAGAVLLAGTDLFLAFEGDEPSYPIVDAALLHVEDLVEAASRENN